MEKKDQYIEGTFRIWKDAKGYIRIKFNGEPESLHYIPKGSKLYEGLNQEFFPGQKEGGQE